MALFLTIPAGTLIGFKAMPSTVFSDLTSSSKSAITDWSGIYPQLTLEQALAYLPNQFDRGFNVVHIVALHSRIELKLVIIDDNRFKNPRLSSTEKAQIVRDAFTASKQLPFLDTKTPLIESVGRNSMVLCIPDAEDFELVVSHELFNSNVMEPTALFTMMSDDLVSVKCVVEVEGLKKDVLLDHRLLSSVLETHCVESKCTELLAMIEKVLTQVQ
ncbi:UNVERIFIED_CONTAM: hypothetical protein HDU68_000794 [Siphonaria sp. JEL0065]|nr:hypothetical protein HDU68_000794 [Siphonaria sp. JEL0065]